MKIRTKLTSFRYLELALMLTEDWEALEDLKKNGWDRAEIILTGYVREQLRRFFLTSPSAIELTCKLERVIDDFFIEYESMQSALIDLVDTHNRSSTSRWRLDKLPNNKCMIVSESNKGTLETKYIDETLFVNFIAVFLQCKAGVLKNALEVNLTGDVGDYDKKYFDFSDITYVSAETAILFSLPLVISQAIKSSDTQDVLCEVKAAINTCELMGLKPTVDHVSFILSVSSKMLQRELKARGCSFKSILSAKRNQEIKRQLGSMTLKQIALTSYPKSPNNFYRNNKRSRIQVDG